MDRLSSGDVIESMEITSDAMDTPPPIPVLPPPPIPATPKSSPTKWVLLGCGGCLGLIVVFGLCAAAIAWFAIGTIKSTDFYTEVMRRAENSPQVREALGTPMESGWSFQGSVNYDNGNGTASLSLPISGPKGSGTLKAEATRQSGQPWQYSVLEMQVEGGGSIDLKDAPRPPPVKVP